LTIAKVRRLFRLWSVYARLDFLFLTQWPGRVLTYWLSDVIIGVGALAAMSLLAERFQVVGDWGKQQIVFMLAYGLTVQGLLEIFFGQNVAYISRRIGRGQLDHTLLQPHSVLTALVTEGFTPVSGVGILVSGVAVTLWALAGLDLRPTPGWLGLLVVQLLSSTAIILSFHFIWGTLAFWAPRGAEEISTTTNRMSWNLRQFPLDGLGPVALGGFMTILPIGFAAWYPSRALLGLAGSAAAYAVTPLAALLFIAVATVVFRRGLAHYARTGSSRYLDFGHRR
jgi:ABC-2 type transport system permease protein